MTARERFVNGLLGRPVDAYPVGNFVSAATYEQMRRLGVEWPDAHYRPESIARLAECTYTELGYDTIMPYFSVVVLAAALGARIDWGEGPWETDRMTGKLVSGPRMPAVRPPSRWTTPQDIAIPDDLLERRETKAIIDSIKLLRARHPDACIVGKVMGPWTLAYHMFGTQDFLMNVILEPDFVRACLNELKHVSVMFANAQIEAGADVITLADHSTGDLVRAETYRDFLLPVHQEITPQIKAPVILHCCGRTLDRMPYFKEAGFVAFHFAVENDPHESKELVGDFGLVGNVGNFVTLLVGRPEDVAVEVQDIVDAGVEIVSPECAVPPQVPDRNLRTVAAAARGQFVPDPSVTDARNLAAAYRAELADQMAPTGTL